MYRLGVMGELRGREEDVGVGGGDDLVPASASVSLDSGVSSGLLCSSTTSSLTEDDAESSPTVGDPTRSSASSSSSDTMQLDGEDIGPLYELSQLLAHLPVRTGLSKYYKGKSQSFASLSDVKCLQHLAKKTTSHISRTKASRSSVLHDVRGPCSKMIAKKTTPRGSSDPLLSRARSRGLLHTSRKPPAYQSKKELCSS